MFGGVVERHPSVNGKTPDGKIETPRGVLYYEVKNWNKGFDEYPSQLDALYKQIEQAYHPILEKGGVLPYQLDVHDGPSNTLPRTTGRDIFEWAESCNGSPPEAFQGDGFEIEYQPSENIIEAGSNIDSIVGIRGHGRFWGAEWRRKSLIDVIEAPNKKYKSVLGGAKLWVAVGVHQVAILGIDLHSVVYQGEQFRFRNIDRVVFFVNPPFVKGMPPPQVCSFQNPANIRERLVRPTEMKD